MTTNLSPMAGAPWNLLDGTGRRRVIVNGSDFASLGTAEDVALAAEIAAAMSAPAPAAPATRERIAFDHDDERFGPWPPAPPAPAPVEVTDDMVWAALGKYDGSDWRKFDTPAIAERRINAMRAAIAAALGARRDAT